jgi:hypothetical protein
VTTAYAKGNILPIAYRYFLNGVSMSMQRVLRRIRSAIFDGRLLDDLLKPPRPQPTTDLDWPGMF